MTGIDTNVLVRFPTRDDPAQAAAAEVFLATLTPEAPGFVARAVMVELVWVLERADRVPRPEIAHALGAPDRNARALLRYRAGGPGFTN